MHSATRDIAKTAGFRRNASEHPQLKTRPQFVHSKYENAD